MKATPNLLRRHGQECAAIAAELLQHHVGLE
jgi:hypothetical protein